MDLKTDLKIDLKWAENCSKMQIQNIPKNPSSAVCNLCEYWLTFFHQKAKNNLEDNPVACLRLFHLFCVQRRGMILSPFSHQLGERNSIQQFSNQNGNIIKFTSNTRKLDRKGPEILIWNWTESGPKLDWNLIKNGPKLLD